MKRSANPRVSINPARDAIRDDYFAAKRILALISNYSTIRMNQLNKETEHELRTKTIPELLEIIERVHWLQQKIV